jgi:hypothetical protein
MTAGTEVLAAWPPAAVATVVGSLLALAGTGIGARAVDATYEMQTPGQVDDPIARVVVKFLVEGDDHVPDPSDDGRTSADP